LLRLDPRKTERLGRCTRSSQSRWQCTWDHQMSPSVELYIASWANSYTHQCPSRFMASGIKGNTVVSAPRIDAVPVFADIPDHPGNERSCLKDSDTNEKPRPMAWARFRRGVLREQHRSLIHAIPESVGSSRSEKNVISGLPTGVQWPADLGSGRRGGPQPLCRRLVTVWNEIGPVRRRA
jgi:hypothetical protein